LADPGILISLNERRHYLDARTITCPAPEVIKGDASCAFTSDIWALGILAYELATGTKPFADEN